MNKPEIHGALDQIIGDHFYNEEFSYAQNRSFNPFEVTRKKLKECSIAIKYPSAEIEKIIINGFGINNKNSFSQSWFETLFSEYQRSWKRSDFKGRVFWTGPKLKSGHLPVPLFWKNFVYAITISKKLNITGFVLESPYLNTYDSSETYYIHNGYRKFHNKVDSYSKILNSYSKIIDENIELDIASLIYIVRTRLKQRLYQKFDDYVIIELGNGIGAQLSFKRKNSSLDIKEKGEFQILSLYKQWNEPLGGVQIETSEIAFVIKYFKNRFFHTTILPSRIPDSSSTNSIDWDDDIYEDDEYFSPSGNEGPDNNDDNRANQLNPNNDAFYSSRGISKP